MFNSMTFQRIMQAINAAKNSGMHVSALISYSARYKHPSACPTVHSNAVGGVSDKPTRCIYIRM